MKALRRHASTIVLALAAVGGVLVVALDRGSISTGEADVRKQNVLPAWRRDDVTELTVTARGKTAQLVRRTALGGQWTWDVEIDGRRGPADEQFVDQYLGSLDLGVWERKASAGADRATMKLDAPRAAVRVAMKQIAYELTLGGEAPSPPGAAYLDVRGHATATYVVSEQLAKALDVEPDSFRTRKIVPYLSTELAALHLDGEGGERHLARAPWGGGRGAGFRFDGTGPHGKVRADANAVDRILIAIGQLSAERFTDPAAGGRPRVTITMVPAASGLERAVIEVGAPCPGDAERVLCLRTAPTRVAACVGAGVVDALVTPVAELVDDKPIGASVDEIYEVKLEAGGRKIEMARAGTGWHVRAPAERDVPGDVGNGVVGAMTTVTGEAFAPGDAAELGLTPPRGRVRVVSPGAVVGPDAGGDREESIEIGEERPAADGKKKIVHVRRLEDGAILVVDAQAARALLPSDLSLRPRKVLDVPARSFRWLSLKTPDRTQRLERPGDGAWTLLHPTGKGLDSDLGLVMDVASYVGSLAAERWVAEKDDGSFGLDPPRIVIEARAENVTKPMRIELGGPAPGGAFARAGDDPAVFVAPRSLESSVTRLLLDRRSLIVDEKSIRRVTLTAGKKELVVTRDGAAARLQGVADGAPSRAAAILAAITDLAAENAASVGAAQKEQRLGEPVLTLKIEREKEGPVELRVGSGDVWRGITVFYVRREGIDATFAVAEGRIRPLLDAL